MVTNAGGRRYQRLYADLREAIERAAAREEETGRGNALTSLREEAAARHTAAVLRELLEET